MNTSAVSLSFIIPAYNEEENIVNTIDAIKIFTPQNYQYEIIVIDHGSSDNTASLAKSHGAKLLLRNSGTVASLRNYGAEIATGSILIFLDADILLTNLWQENIEPIINNISLGEKILTGSWVSVSGHGGWIEKYWFRPQQDNYNTHINSGHMIIGHDVFDFLGGFDEKLETGEDYDISMRAKNMGVTVAEEQKLKAIHVGYPANLIEFIKREYWHGKGDSSSLKLLLKSKVALISLLVLFLQFTSIVFFAKNLSIPACALGLSIAAICLISSYIKFRSENTATILVNSVVFYFYFLARGISSLVNFAHSRPSKHQRKKFPH